MASVAIEIREPVLSPVNISKYDARDLKGVDIMEGPKQETFQRLKLWHYTLLICTALESIGDNISQILYIVGINKVMQKVFKTDFVDELNEFWQTVLLINWSFEEYLVMTVIIYIGLGLFGAISKGFSFFYSRAIAKQLQYKLAKALLSDETTLSFGELMQLNRNVKTVENYIFDVTYRKFYAQVNITACFCFGFLLQYILASLLLVSETTLLFGSLTIP